MIPPVASLEAPLQREKRERTKRENRERKEKRERKEREQRENREKRERKEREKTEKRERKEREKRENRERKEREQREKRQRKESRERESRKRAERERAEREGWGFNHHPVLPHIHHPHQVVLISPWGPPVGQGLGSSEKGGPGGPLFGCLFFKIIFCLKLHPSVLLLLLQGLGALTRLPSTGFPLLALAWYCL